jgi:hypothetical protein
VHQNLPMLPQRQTARLTLAPASWADLDAFCGLLTDPAVRLYLCDDARLARQQVSELLDAHLALAPEGPGALDAADSWRGLDRLRGGARTGVKVDCSYRNEIGLLSWPKNCLRRRLGRYATGMRNEEISRSAPWAAPG